jgi:hypothetical protein
VFCERGGSLAFSLPRLFVARVLTLAARHARADPSAAPHTDAPVRPKGSDAIASVDSTARGIDLLVSAGWGASTGNVGRLELAPYGASLGMDLGYTWSTGFRLGGYFTKSLGQALPQHRDPWIGREYDFIADTSSWSGGLSLGWDLPVYAFVLRYALGFGVTTMHWNFQEISAKSADYAEENFGDGESPSVGVHLAPGIALLWPYHWFEAGVGFDYLAQVKDTIPSGFVGKLLVGVRR